MAGALSIRPGRPDDVPAVHGAILALARHVGGEDHVLSVPDDLLRHAFCDDPHVAVAIAEIGSAFAGMCLHFPIYSTWMGRPGVFVQDLFVDPSHRGRKVGEALLRHVARLSRDRGGVYLRLSVDTDNLSAVRFYERLGIRHSDYEQIQKITGDDFVAFCEAGDTA
jgi:ribosomal protein S18 acetylase RimI-like enzyme